MRGKGDKMGLVEEINLHKYQEQIANKVYEEYGEYLESIATMVICCGNAYVNNWYCITVFFSSNAELKEKEESGECKRINKTFYKMALKYDEKQLISSNYEFIHFDSKEQLDKCRNGLAGYFM